MKAFDADSMAKVDSLIQTVLCHMHHTENQAFILFQ